MGTTNILDLNNRVDELEKSYPASQVMMPDGVTSVEEALDEVVENIAVDKTDISATTNPKLNSNAWVKKCGSVVCIQLGGLKNVQADTTTELFILDAKYRPTNRITIDSLIPSATAAKPYRLRVESSGKVTAYLYGSVTADAQDNIITAVNYVI